MKVNKTLALTALSAVIALGGVGVTGAAMAAGAKEKCYGVAKAGKNDCQTAVSSCAGTNKVDGNPNAFVVLPAGTCDKLAGGHLKPMKG